jgi:adenylate cyclase
MLGTVRAKLFALVALTGGSALVALAVLAWLMQRQLVDLMDARMPEAVEGLEMELGDDLHDVESTVHTLEAAAHVVEALRGADRGPVQTELALLREHHPLISVAVFEPSGMIVAQQGLPRPPRRLSDIDGLPDHVAARELTFRGLVPHGCQRSPGAGSPAYAVLHPIADVGLALACLPIDAALLEHTSVKLAVELAVVESAGHRIKARTPSFPIAVVGQNDGELSLVRAPDARTWAVQRVDVAHRLGLDGVAIVAALDVTEVRATVLRDIGAAGGVITLLSLLGVVFGSRIARNMSHALTRVSAAMKRLQQGDYSHVTGVHSGDEIENLAAGFNTMVDGLRERDNLRTTFGKYMTRTVMDHLLAGKVELGGETLRVTVLFTDIRSFSTISERMDAHALVSLLNEYFAEMVTIIMQEEGVVDKFIGDAIMAVFGAPVTKEDDAERAVRAAVRMREALAELNQQLSKRGLPPIRAGVGIHTGEVVAGNIGSEARMEYTVIGDAVNVASRLEGATKDLGEDLLVSEDTRAQAGDAFAFRSLGELRVKGRHGPVRVYAVDGPAPPTETRS